MTPEKSWCGRRVSCVLARRWLTKILANAGVDPRAADDAGQVLGELVNNAVLHTRSGAPGGRFTVRVRIGGSRIRLEVTDAGSDEVPVARRAEPDQESGHGLDLIEALTAQWWTRANGEGRTVFAEIAAW